MHWHQPRAVAASRAEKQVLKSKTLQHTCINRKRPAADIPVYSKWPKLLWYVLNLSRRCWRISHALQFVIFNLWGLTFMNVFNFTSSATGFDGEQALGVQLLQLGQKKRQLINGEPLPLSQKSYLSWLGFTAEGQSANL